jgi:hypothetical protein
LQIACNRFTISIGSDMHMHYFENSLLLANRACISRQNGSLSALFAQKMTQLPVSSLSEPQPTRRTVLQTITMVAVLKRRWLSTEIRDLFSLCWFLRSHGYELSCLIYKVTSCSVAWRHIIALEASHNNLVLDSQADETPGAKIIGVSIGDW